MSVNHREIFRGAAWIAAGTASGHALSLVTSVVAARAVGPSAYGTVGMGLVLLALANAFGDLGLSPAIASGRMPDRAVTRANRVLCVAGLAAAAAVALVAPAAARFFGEAAVAPVVLVLAPTLALNAATVVPQALMARDGRFRTLAALRTFNQAVVAGATLALAFTGAGLWILVVPGLLAAVAMVPATWVGARRPTVQIDGPPDLGRFLIEGAHVTGNALCTYVSRNADNAVVGRLAGDVALGLYAFAYNLLLRPLELFSHSLAPVMIRTLGRVRDDRARTSEAVVHVSVGVLRVGAPVLIGGALTCDLFVPLVFGRHWEPAVPLVRVLMLTGAVQLVGPIFGSMVMARGSSAFLLRWGLVTAAASLAAFILGAWRGGALGVAVAYLAYSAGAVGVMYPLTRAYFGLRLLGLGRLLAGVARDLFAMAGVVLLVAGPMRRAGLAAAPRLAIEVMLGGLAYVTCFRLFAASQMRALIDVLPHPLGRAIRWGVRIGGDGQSPSTVPRSSETDATK